MLHFKGNKKAIGFLGHLTAWSFEDVAKMSSSEVYCFFVLSVFKSRGLRTSTSCESVSSGESNSSMSDRRLGDSPFSFHKF